MSRYVEPHLNIKKCVHAPQIFHVYPICILFMFYVSVKKWIYLNEKKKAMRPYGMAQGQTHRLMEENIEYRVRNRPTHMKFT